LQIVHARLHEASGVSINIDNVFNWTALSRIGIDDVNGSATHFRSVLFLALCLTVVPAESRATNEKVLPADALSGAEHLLELAGPANDKKFQPERVAALMDFIIRPKKDSERYSAGGADGFSSSYNEVDVRTRLVDLLRYSFNPAIPWFTTSPASLRSTSWKHTEKPWTELPRLWELVGVGDSPVVVRGMETVENTPDLTTGGYYRYDLYRTLILFTSGARRTVISISKQVDVSEVGRKGYIIGNDDNWTYFYSGEPGLNVTGLGWVKSYMYDSAGISVYTEAGPDTAWTRTANLKWLRAGWSNINMVQNDHIYEGLVRYARALKEIIESPRLPSVNVFENDCLKIAGLSDAALRDKMKSHRRFLTAQGDKLNGGARKHLPEVFWSEGYWEGLSREGMESALVLESLKAHLGKSSR
jgi:hypothetical protein